MNVTDTEKLMYTVIGELSEQNTPFVFKGGLITKVFLWEGNMSNLIRATRDIDATWTGKPPLMENMCAAINNALEKVDPTLHAEAYRQYEPGKSAGIEVVNKSGETVFKMDIDVGRPVSGIGAITVDGKKITCVDAKQILTDKISSVSQDKLFRRCKDLVDLYGLTSCIKFSTNEIRDIANATHREIGDFSALSSMKDELAHGYEKLSGVSKKPDFDTVYQRMEAVRDGFSAGESNLEWDPSSDAWEVDNVSSKIDTEDPENTVELQDDDDWYDDYDPV